MLAYDRNDLPRASAVASIYGQRNDGTRDDACLARAFDTLAYHRIVRDTTAAQRGKPKLRKTAIH